MNHRIPFLFNGLFLTQTQIWWSMI